MRAIVESPLAGDTVTNFRYALWCCRYLWIEENIQAIASHMICPWFMDDSIPAERQADIWEWEWMWRLDVQHWFFTDLEWSSGMRAALARCADLGISATVTSLTATDYWPRFQAGEWPSHTKGFEIDGRSKS